MKNVKFFCSRIEKVRGNKPFLDGRVAGICPTEITVIFTKLFFFCTLGFR